MFPVLALLAALRPVPLRLMLPLVLLCLLFAFPAHAQIQLYRVSGCVDVGNTTVQCVRPMRLELHGVGFTSGQRYFANARFDFTNNLTLQAEYAARSYRAIVQVESLNDTYAYLGALSNDYGYDSFEPDVLLDVTLVLGNVGSATFAGVSFAALPKPQLTGVTGCAGGDNPALNLTFGCLPTRDKLTLQGSGFSSIAESDVLLWLNNTSSLLRIDDAALVLGDNYLVFTLKTAYVQLLEIAQYAGAPVPLYLSSTPRQLSTSWRTDSVVYLQFAPVPPPEYKGWYAGGRCEDQDGLPTGCWEGEALIELRGDYLYASSVTIGNTAVQILKYSTANRLYFFIPYEQFDPRVRYTVTVTSVFNATLVLLDWLSIRPTVGIASFTPCVDTGTQSLLKCSFGSTLLLQPFNWNLSSLQRIELTAQETPGTRLCSNATQLTAETVSCVLPQRWNGWSYELTQSLTAVLYNGSASASASNLRIFDLLNAPRIASVSGCSSTEAAGVVLNECLGGELLTLTGSNFDAGSAWTLYVQQDDNYECDVLQVLGNSTLICQLPVLDASGPALDFQYELVLNGVVPQQQLRSNAIYITFVSAITPLSSSSSSSTAPQAPDSGSSIGSNSSGTGTDSGSRLRSSSSSSHSASSSVASGVLPSPSTSSLSSGASGSSSNSSAVSGNSSGSSGLPAVAIAGLVIGLVVFVCAAALCANALQLRQRVDKLARRMQLSSRRSLEMPEHSRVAMMASEPQASSDQAS